METMTMTRSNALSAARRLAAASCVGAALGLLVGGIGGRLFMALLANLNPEDHGTITDDGFPMGEVTASGTFQLLVTGAALGVLGAGIYLALGRLAPGPVWFRRACVVVGGTVMVGDSLVHSDGVDFTRLEPTWAAIALTLSVPFVFLLVMPPAVDWAVRDDSALLRSRWTWAGLVPWVFPLFPVTFLMVAGWFLARWAGPRWPVAGPWLARGVLVVVFAFGALQLGSEIVEIYDRVGDGAYL
ncbi:MAG: hypothetical protein ABWX60_10475 [Aeromicrobium sp.]